MALTYNQINSITQKKILPKLYDNVFLGNPLLKRFKDKGVYGKIDGGDKVLLPLEYAELAASAWYTGSETLDNTDNETVTAAEYDWKQVYVSIVISRRDELRNSGDSQIIDHVKSKIKNAEKTIRKKLTTGIYSAGTDPKEIVGLRVHLSESNSPGGISQTDNSWWQAQLNSTTTTMTLPAMQTMFNDCSEDDEKPTVLVSNKTLFNSYWGLLQPHQRFVDKNSADAGFTSLLFNGTPYVCDTNAPASQLMFLNEGHLHLKAHKDEDMRFEPFAKPINQNVKVGRIYWFGIFGSSNNRYHGAFTAMTA
jgi:hypothetical protein